MRRATWAAIGAVLSGLLVTAAGWLAFDSSQPSSSVAGVSISSGPDYNPSDLNGGSRGFPAAHLTVNQSLPPTP